MFKFQRCFYIIVMGMIIKIHEETMDFLFYSHMILNSIEKNHLIGARINIPLNLTYNAMLNVRRAPGSNWL
jgi:hypothetical protein